MEKKKGLGIAALVLSIIGVLGCWIPIVNFASIVLFCIAIVLGIIAAIKDNGRAFAIAAIILSVLGWYLSSAIMSAIVTVSEISEYVNSHSGESITTEYESTSKTNSNSGLLGSFIDEINAGIQQGVDEFSESVNEFNEKLSGEVADFVETVNETLGQSGSTEVVE